VLAELALDAGERGAIRHPGLPRPLPPDEGQLGAAGHGQIPWAHPELCQAGTILDLDIAGARPVQGLQAMAASEAQITRAHPELGEARAIREPKTRFLMVVALSNLRTRDPDF
jgi:hypothetical protein